MRCVAMAVMGCTWLVSACSSAPPDRRGVDRDEVLLQVSATGRTDTRPDQARFTAGVQTIGATASEASARNSQTINAVVAALAKVGIAKDDVQTRSITLSRIDYGANRGRFEAGNSVEVRVRDIKRAGEAIAAATQAGGNLLNGPRLVISDPEATGRSAYADAYRAARARADAYAAAAGLKVARVLAIRDTGQASGPDYPMAEEATGLTMQARPVAPPPVVEAGISSREVSVQADFALGK